MKSWYMSSVGKSGPGGVKREKVKIDGVNKLDRKRFWDLFRDGRIVR
jgi:hypothetical protein